MAMYHRWGGVGHRPVQVVTSSCPLHGPKAKETQTFPLHYEIDPQREACFRPFSPDFLNLWVFPPGISALCLNLGRPSARLQAAFVSISLCENRMAGPFSSRSSREMGIEGEESDPNFHFVLKLCGGLCLRRSGFARLWYLPVRCVGVGARLVRSWSVWPWSSWTGGLRVVRLVVRALGLSALSGGEHWGGVLPVDLVGRSPGTMGSDLSTQISATDKKSLDFASN